MEAHEPSTRNTWALEQLVVAMRAMKAQTSKNGWYGNKTMRGKQERNDMFEYIMGGYGQVWYTE